MRLENTGPFWTLKSPVRGLYYPCAYQVRRQQVWGELDAGEPGLNRLADGFDQQRLRQPRHALQQNMPVGQQRDQGPLH